MGIQNQTTSATTQASLMRCSSRLPLSDGSSMPVTAGTEVGAGENHQQGDQKLFPAPRLAYVHRRRGKPEGRFSPHLSPIAFRQQWGNLSHQLPTGFRLRPGVEVLRGIRSGL